MVMGKEWKKNGIIRKKKITATQIGVWTRDMYQTMSAVKRWHNTGICIIRHVLP